MIITDIDMDQEFKEISSKTWIKATDPIKKAGYLEGITDGRDSVFQEGFDCGFADGFASGFKLGFYSSSLRTNDEKNRGSNMTTHIASHPPKGNCELCRNGDLLTNIVTDIQSIQCEKNNVLFLDLKNAHNEVEKKFLDYFENVSSVTL